MVSIEAWYSGLPPLTKIWFTGALITGVIITLGIPPVAYIALKWDAVLKNLQVWRLVTCFFVFGKIGMGWIFSVYLMCQYFRALELNHYPGIRGTAELLYATVFCMICILIIAYFTDVFPSITLLSCFIYIWSRKSPHELINIYGFTFQRWHLPAVMVVIQLIMGNFPFDPVYGILIGHIWVFLTEILPIVYRRTLVTVPEWWYETVEKYMAGLTSPGTGGVGAATPDTRIPTRASWMRGTGYRLDQ